ncbi:unnamed protein product [Closterium sp. NIES-54]
MALRIPTRTLPAPPRAAAHTTRSPALPFCTAPCVAAAWRRRCPVRRCDLQPPLPAHRHCPQFVTSCDTCQRMKISKLEKAGLIQPLPLPEQPWQVVGLDFITGLPLTTRGHAAILVVIDKFSKMGNFIPTKAKTNAEATARLVFDRIITIYGIPATLISDRDPKFTSKFWRELMGLLGTKLAMSSAYHPQIDRQTKRLNQVVEHLLRTTCKDGISNWDIQLPTHAFAYNNASHAATRKSPFFLCEPITPQQPTIPARVQASHDFVTTM